jgi:hypothetical protein
LEIETDIFSGERKLFQFSEIKSKMEIEEENRIIYEKKEWTDEVRRRQDEKERLRIEKIEKVT